VEVAVSAETSLKEGRLDDALSELQEQVKKDPADPALRTFLFQLLTVIGDWDRALTQLNVAGEMDPTALPMKQMYTEALRCELLRKKVFAGETSPMIFGEPEEWVALLTEAVKKAGQGAFEESVALRDKAFDAAPTTSGKVNDQPFEWIADADPRLGPVFEAVVNGRYYWIPIHRVHTVTIDEPEDLRDMVWAPVQFTWTNGGQAVGLIPTRYPGSENSEDHLIRLSRKTDWVEAAPDVWLGQGQRLLATDAGEFPLLEVRTIVLDTAVESPPAEPEGTDG
jgi:type VI secretion system protein ImpE